MDVSATERFARNLPAGVLLAHYEITAFIGAGGMGEVYRARDTRLDRNVALKILPSVYGADHDRVSRFTQESRTMGRVNHPNVVSIFDAGDHDGRPYLVSELLEGETLRALLERERQLPIRRVIEFGIQMGRGLAAAHEKSVIHRDLKPANIFVTTDGHLKILDFGLAKLVHPEWEQRNGDSDTVSALSMPGAILGSISYMSPEQVEARPLDQRSDIFSFGVILYEMLTGLRPFSGSSLPATFSAILKDQPRDIRQLRSDTPLALALVIRRCLEKRPTDRFQSARDLVFSLEELTARPAISTWKSTLPKIRAAALVVAFALFCVVILAPWLFRSPAAQARPLPFRARDWILISRFENLTGEPLFDGTLEYALDREISSSDYVNIVPRTRVDDVLSLMRKPAGTRVDAALGREICLRDGGIRALLTGRISKSDAKYLLDVALLDPQSGAAVATCAEEAFNRDKVIDSVRHCATEVRAKLGEAPDSIQRDQQKLASVTTPSLRALELYSKAMRVDGEGKPEAAEPLLRDAIAEDSQFASAYMALGMAIHEQWDVTGPKEGWRQPAEKAFALAGTVSDRERFFIRGSYYLLTGDNNQARIAYHDLLTLYPDDYGAVDNLAYIYSALGEPQTAADMFARRADLKPQSFFENFWAARALVEIGRDAEADRYRLRAEKLSPQFPPDILRQHTDWIPRLHMLPAYSAWLCGDAPNALQIVSALGKNSSMDDATIAEFANINLQMGRLRDAEAWSQRLADRHRREANLELIAFERNDAETLARYVPEDDQELGFLTISAVGTPSLPPDVRSRVFAFIRKRLRSSDYYADLIQGMIAIDRNERSAGITLIRRGLNAKYNTALAVPLIARVVAARAYEYEGDFKAAAGLLEPTIGIKRHCVMGIGLQPIHDEKGRPLLHYATGDLWLRTQVELARVYRRVGRIDDAVHIEEEVEKLLANADADFVPLQELRALKAGV